MEVEIVEWEGAVLGVNVGHSIATNGILSVKGGDAALPKLLWDFLLLGRPFYVVEIRRP